MRKPLIAGNWKMNGLLADSNERIEGLISKLSDYKGSAEVLVCPSFTMISNLIAKTKGSAIKVGGQDCHFNEKGAHTGDISPLMLCDLGVEYVILGHSERRADHGESNAVVKSKMTAAIKSGLKAILCVGETKEEKESGKTLAVVKDQIINSLPEFFNENTVVIAYEPVWAIGTGLVPTIKDITEVHDFIRNLLLEINKDAGSKLRVLYGGSLKPDNAKEILAIENVDGGLIGGAALSAKDFADIIFCIN